MKTDLLNLGFQQSTCIKISDLPEHQVKEWLGTLAIPEKRRKTGQLKPEGLLLILSQDCDIASNSEKYIELAILTPIGSLYIGNQHAHSTRTLHLMINDQAYEAKANQILTVPKGELTSLINAAGTSPIFLNANDMMTPPLWRSNRYIRGALPDNFNRHLAEAHQEIDQINAAALYPDNLHSYLRALYVYLNSSEELDKYGFKVFGLLETGTPDDKLTVISDSIEELADKLVDEYGYENLATDYDVYCDRENSTFVSLITGMIKMNFDYLSVARGDFGINSAKL